MLNYDHPDLVQRLAEAEATIAALLSGEIDAVVDHVSRTPVLLAEAQCALRESETRFRELASAIDQIFVLRDLELSTFLYISPGYEKIFGRTSDSLRRDPKSWLEAVHDEDRERVREVLQPSRRSRPFEIQYRILRADGSERHLLSRGFPVRNEAGEIYRFASVIEDVTERVALEAQVLQASKLEGIGQLAAGIAHDFNNLLTIIIGGAECALTSIEPKSEATEDLAEVLKAAGRASTLTKQLLAFSRQQVLNLRPVDINKLVEEMLSMLQRLIGEDIEITTEFALNLPQALADSGQIGQVVMNLVVNARDAMPKGGKLLVTTCEAELIGSSFGVDSVAPGRYVVLSIGDTGEGMSRETRHRIFEPFFSTKDVGKGTGLGLSTCYGIMKQSRGWINVESELGIGTTFKVYLPLAREHAAEVRVVPQPGGAANIASQYVLGVPQQP